MADARLDILLTADTSAATKELQIFSIGVTATERGLSDLQKQLIAFGGGVKSFKLPSLAGLQPITPEVTNSLETLKTAVNSVDLTWREFVGQRMGAYMRQFGSHGAAIKQIAEEWKNYKAQVANAIPVLQRSATSIDKVNKSSFTARFAVQNLGNVIRDIPFSVANPAILTSALDHVVASFSQLRQEAGSTKGALQLLGSSILGGGGLLIGFNLLSTAFALLAGHTSKAKEETQKTNVALEEAKKKQEELQSALDKAASSVVNEAAKLADLKAALISVSNETRNLTEETIRQGIAQFLFDKRNEAVQKILSAEIEKQLRLRKQLRPFAETPAFTPEIISTDPLTKKIAQAKDGLRGLNELSFGLEDIFKRLFEKKFDKKGGVNNEIDDIISKAKQLEKAFGNINVFPKLEVDFSTTKEQVLKNAQDVIKSFSTNQKPLTAKFKVQPVLDIIEPQVDLPQFSKEVTDKFEKAQSFLLKLRPNIQLEKTGIDIGQLRTLAESFNRLGQGFGDEFAKIFIGTVQQNLEKGLKIDKAIRSAGIETKFLESSFNALAQSSNTFFDAILNGENVFKSFGSFVKNVFKQIAAEILKTIALAAILQLLSGGKLTFGKSLGKILGFAGGGSFEAGKPMIVGEKGPELIVPKMAGTVIPNTNISSFRNIQQAMQVEVIGRLAGNDILLSNARTAGRNRRNS